MTSRERLLTVLANGKPDRLPAAVHSWMDYFLNAHLGGRDQYQAYEHFGLDMVIYDMKFRDGVEGGMFWSNKAMMETPGWRVEVTPLGATSNGEARRLTIRTPSGTLTLRLEANQFTTWITECPIKEKEDIRVLARHMPYPALDVQAMNRIADGIGDRGILRTHVFGYGQPGCWQDACCFHGTTNMIMAAMDDPAWVHEFLKILQGRKLDWISKLRGARVDVFELGGGDASDTVISPTLFREFVQPYDRPIVDALHREGMKCVYHTCGGMMNILEEIRATGADGSETLTPREMGGNADLAVIKERIGRAMFLVGGFDQFHGFTNCPVERTKQMVRECFRTAGRGGGYLLCPSDHFFDADPANVMAYAQAARECVY
jgi:uroporphyrinogen decarboxylase